MIEKTSTATDGSNSEGLSSIEVRTEAILRAAVEELAAVGYAALSVEAIAARVGIAKTTVYRRYPTKAALVHAAMMRFVHQTAGERPDTGSLRNDLVAIGQLGVKIASSAIGKSVLRLGLENSDPELTLLSREADAEHAARNAVVARRAIDRGEISDAAELPKLMDVLVGALIFKLLFKQQQVDEAEIGQVVDMLLNGVSRTPLRSGSRRR
jgi:AcrR family transcriptional regulator